MKCIGVGGSVFVRPCTRVRAAGKETPSTEKKYKVDRGFRWDPSLQRWKEEERNTGKEFLASDMVIKTKTGDEYVVWPVVHSYLVGQNLKSVTCDEVEELMKQGYTLLDVRLEKDFVKAHAKGAINVPLFRPVSRDDAWSQAKKAVSFLMAMTPTERNTEFTQQVAEAVPSKSKIIVMCNRGGTLETIVVVKKDGGASKTCKDPDRAFGRETRSLKAIFELFQDGFSDMFYVEGGIGQWMYDGKEVEGA